MPHEETRMPPRKKKSYPSAEETGSWAEILAPKVGLPTSASWADILPAIDHVLDGLSDIVDMMGFVPASAVAEAEFATPFCVRQGGNANFAESLMSFAEALQSLTEAAAVGLRTAKIYDATGCDITGDVEAALMPPTL